MAGTAYNGKSLVMYSTMVKTIHMSTVYPVIQPILVLRFPRQIALILSSKSLPQKNEKFFSRLFSSKKVKSVIAIHQRLHSIRQKLSRKIYQDVPLPLFGWRGESKTRPQSKPCSIAQAACCLWTMILSKVCKSFASLQKSGRGLRLLDVYNLCPQLHLGFADCSYYRGPGQRHKILH